MQHNVAAATTAARISHPACAPPWTFAHASTRGGRVGSGHEGSGTDPDRQSRRVARSRTGPPPVGADEVRIAVRAAGLNFADIMARAGLYLAAPKPPFVLGYEVAGEVEAIGEGVSGLAVGQRVMAGVRFGGQAELATAHTGT